MSVGAIERGLSRLQAETKDTGGSEWHRFVLRQAVCGLLDAEEEAMLMCDDFRGYVRRGLNGRADAMVCALDRVYDGLEQRLLLHLGMQRALVEGEEVTP